MHTFQNSARAFGVCALLSCAGCGGRPAEWDAEFQPGRDGAGNRQVAGLTGSVAILDPALSQVLMLTSPEPLALAGKRLGVGRDVVKFETSPARDRLFVLSRGVQPQLREGDEAPQLRVFDGGVEPRELERHELPGPYEQLEVDPLGEWLIIHGSEGLVSNPNELILVELGEARGGKPLPSKTLDSYGGKPVRFTFTGELSVPGAEARRLLVVQREKDLAIIDLADLDAPEITVGLPELAGGGYASPSAVVYHDAVEGEVGSMLAVQLAGDSNVYLLAIGRGNGGKHALSLEANLVDVGGVPSTIDFVQTAKDGGLRLAALVPGKSAAVLIDPASSRTLDVALPKPFDKIRRITDDVSAGSGQDIALLYGKTNTIAFWQLGATTGTPYRSIDAYDISIGVDTVLDIPGESFADRKILSGGGASARQFYVLDLSERKSFPLDVLKSLTLNLSPDGQRLWAFDRGSRRFAQLTFEPLQPSSLHTERPIDFVHDFATRAGASSRSVVALHFIEKGGGQTLAATLFDGLEPRSDRTRFFGALELEGVK